jgi:hypothetical protein
MAYVSAIAMKQQKRSARALARHEPAVQRDAVFRGDAQVLELQSYPGGIGCEFSDREVDEKALEPVGHDGVYHACGERRNQYPVIPAGSQRCLNSCGSWSVFHLRQALGMQKYALLIFVSLIHRD